MSSAHVFRAAISRLTTGLVTTATIGLFRVPGDPTIAPQRRACSDPGVIVPLGLDVPFFADDRCGVMRAPNATLDVATPRRSAVSTMNGQRASGTCCSVRIGAPVSRSARMSTGSGQTSNSSSSGGGGALFCFSPGLSCGGNLSSQSGGGSGSRCGSAMLFVHIRSKYRRSSSTTTFPCANSHSAA